MAEENIKAYLNDYANNILVEGKWYVYSNGYYTEIIERKQFKKPENMILCTLHLKLEII